MRLAPASDFGSAAPHYARAGLERLLRLEADALVGLARIVLLRGEARGFVVNGAVSIVHVRWRLRDVHRGALVASLDDPLGVPQQPVPTVNVNALLLRKVASFGLALRRGVSTADDHEPSKPVGDAR